LRQRHGTPIAAEALIGLYLDQGSATGIFRRITEAVVRRRGRSASPIGKIWTFQDIAPTLGRLKRTSVDRAVYRTDEIAGSVNIAGWGIATTAVILMLVLAMVRITQIQIYDIVWIRNNLTI
jgi:hypothetical protein